MWKGQKDKGTETREVLVRKEWKGPTLHKKKAGQAGKSEHTEWLEDAGAYGRMRLGQTGWARR